MLFLVLLLVVLCGECSLDESSVLASTYRTAMMPKPGTVPGTCYPGLEQSILSSVNSGN